MDYLSEFLKFNKKRSDNSRKTAAALKKQGDCYIFNTLCQLYINRIKWTYNPGPEKVKSIATDLIEKTILFDGFVGFIQKMPDFWVNCKFSIINDLSFYRYPAAVQAFDYCGRPQEGEFIPYSPYDYGIKSNCIIIWDNINHTRPIDTIIYYSERLGYINTQINAAITNIRGAQILACTEEQKKAFNQLYKNANYGTPIQFITYDIEDPASLKPILLTTPEIPDVLKCLYEAWDKTFSDFLNAIGIRSNSEMNKKSGVTPLEITENRQNTDIILNSAMETRLQGIEQAKILGLTGLSVSLSNFEPRTVDETANTKESQKEEISDNEEYENSDI